MKHGGWIYTHFPKIWPERDRRKGECSLRALYLLTPAHLRKSQENLDRKRKANDQLLNLLVSGVTYGCMDIRISLLLFPALSQHLLSTDINALLEKPENSMQMSFKICLRPFILTSSFLLKHENVRINVFSIFIVWCWGLSKTSCKLMGISKTLSTSSVFLLGRIHPQNPKHLVCG